MFQHLGNKEVMVLIKKCPSHSKNPLLQFFNESKILPMPRRSAPGSIEKRFHCPCGWVGSSQTKKRGKKVDRKVCPKCKHLFSRRDRVSYRAESWIQGKRKAQSFSKRELAEAWLGKRRLERDAAITGLPLPILAPDIPTISYKELKEPLLKWWESGSKRKFTPATLRGYKNALNAVLAYWGDRVVMATTPADIDEYIGTLTAKGHAPQTVRNRLDRLEQLHQVGVRRGLIPQAPCPVHRPAPAEKRPRIPASEKQVEAALKKGNDLRVQAIILLARDAGLRRFEIPALTGDQVDLEGRWIRRVKGKRGRLRDVPILSRRLYHAIAAMDPQMGKPLFHRVANEHSVTSLLRVTLGKHNPGLHSLRHSCATQWANDPQIGPVRAQAWLGHSDLRTTMRYVRPETDPPRQVIESISARIPPEKKKTAAPLVLKRPSKSLKNR